MFESKTKFLWVNLIPALISIPLGLFIIFFANILPPKLPLFYSLPWGESQLVNHQQLLIVPASVILITLLNYIISLQLHQSQKFFKMLLFSSSYLLTLILTITFLKIILIFL
jgi:hypothetical protein